MKKPAMQCQKKILKRYSRFIVHMRKQIEDQRFGLVFGAGSSRDLGFPDWKTLIKRIAEHPDIKSPDLINHGNAQSSTTQLLYHKFRETIGPKAAVHTDSFNKRETFVQSEWRKIVHSSLYKDVPETIAAIKKRDSYLWAFLPVIKLSKITINYNFDDTLQKLLADARSSDEKSLTRGYTTVFNNKIQGYPGTGIIYHPNGFLPRKLTEKPSDHLVFLEDSFADQLIESMTGYHTAIAYHYSQKTCLFIGLSLEDPMLKHLLRQNGTSCPGHYHYFISFVSDPKSRDKKTERVVMESNFEVYNLNTLFLNREEIAALGVLLSMPQDEFVELASEVGVSPIYFYYITGCVSVGKSTAVSNFSSLSTHDEWLEARESGMEKDPSKVDPKNLKRIDEWVYDQIGKKNKALLRQKTGIHIVDRAPLDAFAFCQDKNEWGPKATAIRGKVTPGASDSRLCKGHIIFLKGDPNVMDVRSLIKHKDTTKDLLELQQDNLLGIYDRYGVTIIDTRNLNSGQVARQIARVVFVEDYKPIDMHEWLLKIEKGEYYD